MATKKSAIPKPEVVTKAASTTVKRKKKKSSYKPKPNVTRVCRSAGRGCQGRSASACRTLASAKCKVKRVSSASTTTAGAIVYNWSGPNGFLSTTQKDNIKNTVNYYALCLYIKKYILKYSCNKKIINSDIKIFIKSFSSLINSGYLTIEILCHTKKVIKIRL